MVKYQEVHVIVPDCTWCFHFVVQMLSHVWLFVSPWTAAHQASLSFTISRSLLKLVSIESVMPSNHLILSHRFPSCPQSFPASGSLPMSLLLPSGDQNIVLYLLYSVVLFSIAKWINYMYTYMPSCLDFLPIQVTTEHRVEFPEIYSRFSLVVCFIHSIDRV